MHIKVNIHIMKSWIIKRNFIIIQISTTSLCKAFHDECNVTRMNFSIFCVCIRTSYYTFANPKLNPKKDSYSQFPVYKLLLVRNSNPENTLRRPLLWVVGRRQFALGLGILPQGFSGCNAKSLHSSW